jgi:acetylornithine deacetylase/succinyl-diaminopimelate desuccinylase-like protein
MAAIFVANMARYAREKARFDRDVILALTADEEQSDSPHNGVRWLLANHRALIDAELAINEGGGGAMRNGRPFRLAVQLAEKVYQTFQLEVLEPGGHSASPRRDNAIYRLAAALGRLAQLEFPPRLNPVTRAFFERMAAAETPAMAEAIRALLAGRTDAETVAPIAGRPDYNAQMRTTCVATMLEAGHAENALPQSARAIVNCRILPDESVAEVAATLKRVVADKRVAITTKGTAVESPPSAPHPEVMQAVATLSVEMWPGVPLNTTMSAGYTDNRWLRNAGIPAYGVSGLFTDPGNNGVHGRNERVDVKAVHDSRDFLDRLVRMLAAPQERR